MTKSVHLFAPLTLMAATFVLATPSHAQQARSGEQLGMRYLSWAGKPAGTSVDGMRRPADTTPRTQTVSVAAAPTPVANRPSRYGAPLANSNGLTPASAWIGRGPAPMPQVQQPQQAPQQAETPPVEIHASATVPMPVMARQPAPRPALRPMPQSQQATAPTQQAATAPEYDPSPTLQRQDAYYAAPPQVQEAMHAQPQPSTLPAPPVIPTAEETPADPMAPRRDALIFRMNQQAPAQQAQTQQVASTPQTGQTPTQPVAQQMASAPPRLGARYYSVHREAGHVPDPMVLPESAFIGGPATDLAEPPPVPVMTRTVNGRAQTVVANQDPSLP